MDEQNFIVKIWPSPLGGPTESQAEFVTDLVRVQTLFDDPSITWDDVLDRGFRQKRRMALSSRIADASGQEVFEGDIIAFGSISGNEYYVQCLGAEARFVLRKGLNAIAWSKGMAANSIRLCNYYDEPGRYSQLALPHRL